MPEERVDPVDPELQRRLADEAVNGRLPLLKEEREYSFRGIFSTSFATAIAAWCFLIGGYAANVVGAVQGAITLIAGCVVGVFLSSVACALGCNRYGLEQIDFTKSTFGQRGARLILVFYVINQIGWTGIILVMLGSGVKNVLAATVGIRGGELLVGGVVLAAMPVCYWLVVRGVHVLNVFNKVVTPGLLAVTCLLFYALFSRSDWATLTTAAPLEPTGDRLLNYAIAFEYGLGAGFSWWPGIGFLTRNTDSQRNAFYPQILTFGLLMGVVCCTGLFAALLFRSYDPTEWMIQVGGPIFGVAALALIAVANLSASALMIYVAALGLRHLPRLRTTPWKLLVAISLVPVLGYVLFPQFLYDQGGTFLAYNATMYAPISGVLLVDYLLLRRQRLDVSQVFEEHPSGDYWFTRGFNLVALLSVLAGQLLYLLLFDPVSNEAHPLFRHLTASAPSVLLPMVLYGAGMKLFVMRRQGGYRRPIGYRPLREPNI